jgi:hypothetical protein
MAGASIRSVEAHSPEQYLSNLGRAVRHSIPAPTAMVVCYPANPTAQVVDLRDGVRAAIHGDKQLWGMLGDTALQRGLAEAIAFLHAVGKKAGRLSPVGAEKPGEERQRGYSIHIVVPIEHDALPAAEGAGESFDGSRHFWK